MNERIIQVGLRTGFAVAVAVGPVAMAESVGAVPQTVAALEDGSDICGPIYIENKEPIDPKLQSAVDTLEADDVAVHVQVLDGVESKGRTDAALIQYQSDIKNKCDWPEDERGIVIATVVKRYKVEIPPDTGSPGRVRLFTAGQVDRALTDGEYDDAKGLYGAALRQKKPHQDAAAIFVNSVEASTFELPATGGGDYEGLSPLFPPEPRKPINWAPAVTGAKWAGGIGGSAALLGGVGYGGYTARKRSKGVSTIKLNLLETVPGKKVALDRSQSDLRSERVDNVDADDEALLPIIKEGKDVTRVGMRYTDILRRTETLRRFDLAAAQALNEEVATAEIDGKRELGELAAIVLLAEENLSALPGNIERATTVLQGINADIERLAKAGWNVDSLTAVSGTLSEEIGAVQNLDAEEHDLTAVNMIAPLVERVLAQKTYVGSLEAKQAGLEGLHAERTVEINNVYTRILQSSQVFNALANEYDQSCIDPIASKPDELEDLLESLRAKQLEAAAFNQTKSPEAVASADQANAEFNAIVGDVDAHIAVVNDHKAALAKLVVETGRDLKSLRTDFNKGLQDARSWGTDVETDTLQGIIDFESELDALDAAASTDDGNKPAYYSLQSDREAKRDEMNAAISGAVEQRRQMNTMRKDLGRSHQELSADLTELKNYVNRYSGHVSGINTNFTVPKLDVSGTRVDLTERSESYAEIQADIAAAQESANQQHQAELDRLEAIEQARLALQRAREAEERQRQQEAQDRADAAARAAQQSSSGGDAGGGHSRGGDA